ncbi:glycerol-3-phosphate dehydrogenase [Microvirga aerophila]|uniref:Glycerol-3-phosphate dehydrogenase n=1 Tax=Microvirga aerophila TaxID=670291 RepID=A0A512BPB9_9HYPH|nr:glycerol-3-phosphate dehydrogenase [Microvirga aerophila]GEO13802.1 glycerol-3-phosphate dehydrogenase [Microvirga aerophila]
MSHSDFDIVVIGGGINGCGIARDAVGRGYSVLLAEMQDLASGTSSASTKLIHGGLRYLEHYEIRLVRESLMEREVLWRMAPHIIWPLRFVLPHHRGLRPAWLLRLGLFLYDHIGGRKLLPKTRTLDLTRDPAGKPLRRGYAKALEYSDAWVQDARLVALNARDAADQGAEILTRTKVTRLQRRDGGFLVELTDQETGQVREVTARLVVNAAGPWVDQVLRQSAGENDRRHVRLVQGSHIVVRKLFDHDRCYIFQNKDNRIIFAIPYEDDFTLIGTTDRDFNESPDRVQISREEIVYLCEAASEYFERGVMPDDVVWTYSGVRPLYDDGASKAQEATRDYVIKVDGTGQDGAIVNIFGGKITTYRRLAESVLEKIEQALGAHGAAWTAGATLPGGDFPVSGFGTLVSQLKQGAPAVPDVTIRRLARNYGTRARQILGQEGQLGRVFGADLGENEVNYLMDQEWARNPEDVLWRRSKLGLRFSPDETAALTAHMEARVTARDWADKSTRTSNSE